jgi:hypothetical protein
MGERKAEPMIHEAGVWKEGGIGENLVICSESIISKPSAQV